MRFRSTMNIPIRSGIFTVLLLISLVLFSPPSAGADSDRLNENEVKAAYLYNFTKYVEWPAASFNRENTPLIICILGNSPMNEVIETLSGKTVRNRRLVIRHFSRIEDLSECQVLFINASVKSPLTQILSAAASRSVLTVSDSRGFAASGGIIELVQVGGKIRFIINNRAAQSASLQISSHLLRLATTVLEKP